jgi:phage-related holin
MPVTGFFYGFTAYAISVQVSLNIPGYVSGFISTLSVKEHQFSFLGGVKTCSLDVIFFVFCIFGISVL